MLCEYLCWIYCQWQELGGGTEATRLHPLSLLGFVMSGVWRSFDLETILARVSILVNLPLRVIWVYFSPIAHLLCVLDKNILNMRGALG